MTSRIFPSAGFVAIVPLVRDKSSCSMNGRDMLAAEVKIGSLVSK
jgi:hypothetical protein